MTILNIQRDRSGSLSQFVTLRSTTKWNKSRISTGLWSSSLTLTLHYNIVSVLGGGSLFAVHNECEYYDQASDQWLSVAPMTTRRSRCGVAVAHGKLYAIGGYVFINKLSDYRAQIRVSLRNKCATHGTVRKKLRFQTLLITGFTWNWLILSFRGCCVLIGTCTVSHNA